jgi:hypothetical protein
LIPYFSSTVGTQALIDKIKEYKPKIAVFNGKGIYEVFSANKEFHLGKQPEPIDGTNTVSLAKDLSTKPTRLKWNDPIVCCMYYVRVRMKLIINLFLFVVPILVCVVMPIRVRGVPASTSR